MKKINFILLVCTLFIVGCSSDSSDPPTTDPIDNNSGENPDNNDGNNDSSNTLVFSNDITNLWIGNMTIATANGDDVESIEIIRSEKSTLYGNSRLRDQSNIPDSLGIISVTGGTYYTNGEYPKVDDDIFNLYSDLDNKPNVTIGMTVVPEDEANAHIIINEETTVNTQESRILNGRNTGRTIETGAFTIKAIDGVDFDGHTEFKFNVEEMTDKEFGNLIFGPTDNPVLNFDFVDFKVNFREVGNSIPIQVIELAIDDENNNQKRILPTLGEILID